uniref:Plancitoxin-1 n=1 Tax=Trichuris muris TaxID=70415 RepID=A0A5S6QFH6_TRIMR
MLFHLVIPSTAAADWTNSDLSVTNDQNPLHNIAGELNKKPAAAAGHQPVILAFNALPPRSSSPPATQSKSTGVFFYEPSAAFATYLIHSVPQWPDMYNTATVLAELGKKTMPARLLCLMLPSGEVSNWAKGMAYESPLIHFYQNNIESADITNEDVRKLVEGTAVASSAASIRTLKTATALVEVKIFSVKPSNLDLYSSVINLCLGTTLTIWNIAGKGVDIVPKTCNKFYKVQYVNASDVQIMTQTIKRDDDKTIWAYSQNGTWLCVSNSPRQASQLKAPKGAVCINDAAAHAAFKALAKTVDGCS